MSTTEPTHAFNEFSFCSPTNCERCSRDAEINSRMRKIFEEMTTDEFDEFRNKIQQSMAARGHDMTTELEMLKKWHVLFVWTADKQAGINYDIDHADELRYTMPQLPDACGGGGSC